MSASNRLYLRPSLHNLATRPILQAAIPREDRSYEFADLLVWGWNAYDRLGVMGGRVGISEFTETEISFHRGLELLSLDVRDLGRVLLQMLLQPFKVRRRFASPADFSESLQVQGFCMLQGQGQESGLGSGLASCSGSG